LSICIPSSVERLGNYCFGDCESLSTVTFESGSQLLCIGEHAFCSCSSLLSISIPSSVEKLGAKCFYRCRSISTIAFESGSHLSTVDDANAFDACDSLRSLFIPSALQGLFGEEYSDADFDIIVRRESDGGSG
jgi:hypothetical protein